MQVMQHIAGQPKKATNIMLLKPSHESKKINKLFRGVKGIYLLHILKIINITWSTYG